MITLTSAATIDDPNSQTYYSAYENIQDDYSTTNRQDYLHEYFEFDLIR